MQTAELAEGRSYAFRERRSAPLLKVKLLTKVGRRGHVKVRYEDGPHPGLEEYVQTRQLVVPWTGHKALLRDEERIERIRRSVKRDPAREEAISTVLAASGEPSAGAGDWLTMPEVRFSGSQIERDCRSTQPSSIRWGSSTATAMFICRWKALSGLLEPSRPPRQRT